MISDDLRAYARDPKGYPDGAVAHLCSDAADVIDRLTAALEGSVAVPAWQPIETAPTDEAVLISAWLENQKGGERFMDIARSVFGEWVDEHDGEPIWPPTHWMPLPAFPIPRQERAHPSLIPENNERQPMTDYSKRNSQHGK